MREIFLYYILEGEKEYYYGGLCLSEFAVCCVTDYQCNVASRKEQFIEGGCVDIFHQFTREELGGITGHYGVPLRVSLKGEVQKELVEALVKRGVLSVEEDEGGEMRLDATGNRCELSESEVMEMEIQERV